MAWCCGLATSWAGACFCPAWPCVAAPRFAGAWCGNQYLPHASNAVSACSRWSLPLQFPRLQQPQSEIVPSHLEAQQGCSAKKHFADQCVSHIEGKIANTPWSCQVLQCYAPWGCEPGTRVLQRRQQLAGPKSADSVQPLIFLAPLLMLLELLVIVAQRWHRCWGLSSSASPQWEWPSTLGLLEDHIFQSKCQWHQSANGFCNNKSHSSSLFLLWWCHTCFWSSSSVWQLYL